MSTTHTNKPAIVIVPGAFHDPWHYSFLQLSLQKAGYEVTTCDLPSMGPQEPEPDISADVACVRSAIKAYTDQSFNIVLVMHSYGGIVGTIAAEGHLPKDQPNSKGVISLAYISALIPDKGLIMSLAKDGEYPPWFRRTKSEVGKGWVLFPDKPPWDPVDLFYHDCAPEVAAEAVAKMKPLSEGPAFGTCRYAAWKEVDSYYLVCENDKAFPAWIQEMQAGQEGGRWVRVEKIGAGHSPFLSRTEETAEFVRRCAGEEL